MICTECGSKFCRSTQYYNGKTFIWICIKHKNFRKECFCRPVKEDKVMGAFEKVLKGLYENFEQVEISLKEFIYEDLISQKKAELRQAEIEVRAAQDEMLVLYKAKDRMTESDYGEQEYSIAIRIGDLLAIKQKAENDYWNLKLTKYRAEKMANYIAKGYNYEDIGDAIKRTVDRILVINHFKLKFVFKCGSEIDAEI